MSRTALLPAALTLLLGAAPLRALESGLEEGQLFPDLMLPSLADGRPRSISSFRSRKVLLIAFASW